MNDDKETLREYVTAVLEDRLASADYLRPYLEPVDLRDIKTPETVGPSMSGVLECRP